ncbi:hypothetical protein KAW65_08980 [candidate division WOR-3 bacterium]|nr:hypothetical protein [candidate division WOR-3 bacterium]
MLVIVLLLSITLSEKDNHILQGIDYIYEEHYDSAYKEFNTLITLYPEDPEGYFYLSSLFETLLSFEPNPEMRMQLDSIADIGVRLAENKLKLENNAYNLFYLGSTYGERAVQRALKGDWLGCFIDAIGVKKNLELALKEDSTLFDIYMGYGLYDYYLGKYLSFIPKLQGKKTKGIQELELAANLSKYAKNTATFFLIKIYIVEGMYNQAMQTINKFRQIYPENIGLLYDEAEANFYLKNWSQTIESCKQSLSFSELKKPKNRRNRSSCYLLLGQTYYKIKNFNKAKENFELAIQEINNINERWAKRTKKDAQRLLQKCSAN